MKLEIKTVNYPYARLTPYEWDNKSYAPDLTTGYEVTILDEGTTQEGEFNEQHIFLIQTMNGKKRINFNQTSLNNLITLLGTNTAHWVNQTVTPVVTTEEINGENRTFAIFA